MTRSSTVHNTVQVCGITATSFLPTLELDAYHLYSNSDVWAEAGFEEAIFHNNSSLEDTRISQKGVWLPAVSADQVLDVPYLQIERRLEHSSSAAVLSTLVVFESAIGMLQRDVVTAKINSTVWNLHVIHRPAPRSQLVVVLNGTQQAAAGSPAEDLFHEWSVHDDEYAELGMYAVHILLTEDSDGIQMLINGREAVLQRIGAANTGMGLSVVRLKLLSLEVLHVGGSHRLSVLPQNRVPKRAGNFYLLHAGITPLNSTSAACQISLQFHDAQHRWDMFSEAMGRPFTNFLWPYERTQPWYPSTWVLTPDGVQSIAVRIEPEVAIATVSEPGALWEGVEDAELHVCTHPDESLEDGSGGTDTSDVWTEFEDQPCAGDFDGLWQLEVFLGTCKALQSEAEIAATETLTSVSSFSTAWEQESTTARIVSVASASAGGLVNAGVSAAIGQAAATAGEIGQAVLSGGGGVGLAPVLDGLQMFGISARLPVRHARLLYSLASGVSWASLDVLEDSSSFYQHDPLSELYSSLATSDPASASSDSSSATVTQEAASEAIASAQETLAVAASQTVQDAKGAWELGYVRILVFLVTIATATALHSVLLLAWASSSMLASRVLPRFLAFPRFELMLSFAFVPALGEAVGLLVVAGATAAVWVCSTAVLLLFCAVIGTVWYILQTYVARRGEFGLHYFVGAADSGASESSPATQKALFDRLHGYWSCLASSQVQSDELEPARSDRLVRGNVSPLAAVAAARQLQELDKRRSEAHDRFIAQFEAQHGEQQHATAEHAKVIVEDSRAVVPVAEGYDGASGSESKHSEPHCTSEGGNLRAEFMRILPSESVDGGSACPDLCRVAPPASMPCRQLDHKRNELSARRAEKPDASMTISNAKQYVGDHISNGHACICQGRAEHHGREPLAEAVEQPSTQTAPVGRATFSTAGAITSDGVPGHQTCSDHLPGQQHNPAASLAGRSDGCTGPRKSAVLSIHNKLQKSKTIPRSPLLALPPETELGEGWTVADEVELAAASQEFLDRFGLLFELHRGHKRTPVMYMVLAQIFKFSTGMVAGMMNTSLPGSWGAYVGLTGLAIFKLLSALITTAQPVKIDRLGAFGEALSGWMEAAATACMVALQGYYTGDYGTKDDNVYLQTLQNGGIASGTEGSLQLAVLVLSILAVLCNLLWIWGFIILRILGLFYVKKQVAAIEAGTREPAPARVVAENDMVQQALAPHRPSSAPSAVPPDAPSPQLSRSRRLWNWVKRVKRPSKQVQPSIVESDRSPEPAVAVVAEPVAAEEEPPATQNSKDQFALYKTPRQTRKKTMKKSENPWAAEKPWEQ